MVCGCTPGTRSGRRVIPSASCQQHDLFGEDGFEKMVASIEKTLGIYDLAQFTPR